MAFIDTLKNLSEQVKKRKEHIKGEQATKQALILPFLQVLGYDIYDPTEVQPEYIADFAKKKASGQFEKVDFAIHLNGAPAIFVECKSVEAVLESFDGQLARYFNATPSVKTAVLTNGIRYLFYTDLHEPNIMSKEPFFELDILSFSETDVDTVRIFAKTDYDAGAVHTAAEEMIYVGKLTTLVGSLLRNPSENFIRFLLSEVDLTSGKRLTAKVVDRFVPVVRKSIQTTLLEMATRSIRLETEEPKLAVVTPIKPDEEAKEKAEAPRKGVVTTEEELEGVGLITKICADSSLYAKHPITHRDGTNYMGLHLQESSRFWFLRLFCDSRKKAITTKIPVEQAKLLSPGFEVEESPAGFGVSRVYIQGVKDLERLRPLVLLAYEEEAKGRESGGSSGEAEGGATA